MLNIQKCACFCHQRSPASNTGCSLCYKHEALILWKSQGDGHNEDQEVPDQEC
jgi:hypothetical protein